MKMVDEALPHRPEARTVPTFRILLVQRIWQRMEASARAELDPQLPAGSRRDRQIIEKFLLNLFLLGAGCVRLARTHGPLTREANPSDLINGIGDALFMIYLRCHSTGGSCAGPRTSIEAFRDEKPKAKGGLA